MRPHPQNVLDPMRFMTASISCSSLCRAHTVHARAFFCTFKHLRTVHRASPEAPSAEATSESLRLLQFATLGACQRDLGVKGTDKRTGGQMQGRKNSPVAGAGALRACAKSAKARQRESAAAQEHCALAPRQIPQHRCVTAADRGTDRPHSRSAHPRRRCALR